MSGRKLTADEVEAPIDRAERRREVITEYILPTVRQIEVIDGHGRRYTANTSEVSVELTGDGRGLRVTHDGDTSHGVTEGAVWARH